jgi:hypothetical protein
MGHQTTEIGSSFVLPSQDGVMFVFTPTSPYTADDAERTARWVRSGGVLIYASEEGDPELDRVLGVSRIAVLASSATAVATPVLVGVTQVAGGDFALPIEPAPEQVAILRTRGGSVLAYVDSMGSGKVVVFADPLVLCNGYLEKLDNGRMAADLLGIGGASASIAFDEYHHGFILSDLSPQAWVLTPWGAALLWLLVAVFIGLLLRGRRFGPLIARPVAAAPMDVEWAVALGELLRRSGARAVTLGLLATASERAVAARTGLPLQPRERFWNALWIRAPELASELAEAEHALYGSAGGDAEVLKAAQRLHRVAYPVSKESRRLRQTPSKEVK